MSSAVQSLSATQKVTSIIRTPNDTPFLPETDIIKSAHEGEDGMADLYARAFSENFVYDHSEGTWYIWREHFWEEDFLMESLSATRKISEMYDSVLDKYLSDKSMKDVCKKLKSAATATRTLRTKKNLMTLAASGKNKMGISGREWDSMDMTLACKNGIVDLKTGKIRPGRQGDYVKNHSPTFFDKNAKAPVFERFLKGVFLEDTEVIDFVQRLFGYGISGKGVHHIIPIFWGEGRNGKGTLLEVLTHVLGRSYVSRANTDSLMDQTGPKMAGHDADKIALMGKRVVWASESSEGEKFNISRVKELVGGETLTARPPYGKKNIEFTPTHLLLLLTNHRPVAPANDLALWERIILVPFLAKFTKDNPETDLRIGEKMKAEAPGILNWLVEGCLKWQSVGLTEPTKVKAYTEDYHSENDIFSNFIAECCDTNSEESMIKGTYAYDNYVNYAKSVGGEIYTRKKFGIEMHNAFNSIRRKDGIYYLGVNLK